MGGRAKKYIGWCRHLRHQRRERRSERRLLVAREKDGESTWPSCSVSSRIPFPSFLRVSSTSPLPSKKRHLVQTITPVPGAIGHQQRVKAAAITNSDSLIPLYFHPPLPFLFLSLSLSSLSPIPSNSLSSYSSPSYFPVSSHPFVARFHSLFPSFHPFPDTNHSLFPSFRFSPLVFLTLFPFTFGRRYRKSNFVTGTASTHQDSVLYFGEITRRSVPQPRKISLIKRHYRNPLSFSLRSSVSARSNGTRLRLNLAFPDSLPPSEGTTEPRNSEFVRTKLLILYTASRWPTNVHGVVRRLRVAARRLACSCCVVRAASDEPRLIGHELHGPKRRVCELLLISVNLCRNFTYARETSYNEN